MPCSGLLFVRKPLILRTEMVNFVANKRVPDPIFDHLPKVPGVNYGYLASDRPNQLT